MGQNYKENNGVEWHVSYKFWSPMIFVHIAKCSSPGFGIGHHGLVGREICLTSE